MSDKTYMTNQEAVEVMTNYFPAVPHAKVRYAAAMGVEALKKRVPKKPIFREHNGNGWFECPVCHDNEIESCEQYCPSCGQALDWGE